MRLASFNVENLFDRARALNQETWLEGREILNAYSELSKLFEKPVYTQADKTKILNLIDALGLTKSDDTKFITLRQNHGQLLKRPRSGPLQVIANGRADWIGWLELKKEAVNEIATQMTGKVIQELEADVLAVVEAENRVALKHFNDQLLKPIAAQYNSIMLIDGNDDRGIDVGLLLKAPCQITSIVSHVDDLVNDLQIFSRDCPEFSVRVDEETTLLVMVNHFKSKGHGTQAASNQRRKQQSQRVREIYDQRRAEGIELIAVMGDFNDTPTSDPLSPLLGNGSDLRDIAEHPLFESDGRPGTYANGTASNKIDYILLSPALFTKVKKASVLRKGVWGGVNGTLFPHYDEMTLPIHAASDHAALWVDFTF